MDQTPLDKHHNDNMLGGQVDQSSRWQLWCPSITLLDYLDTEKLIISLGNFVVMSSGAHLHAGSYIQ